jgi:H+/Cl- antiporter ClcA
MTHDTASLAEEWRRSPTAQGVALGLVLGPVGMLLAYLFSSRDKREVRVFGALKGSLAAGTIMLVVGALVFIAVSVL